MASDSLQPMSPASGPPTSSPAMLNLQEPVALASRSPDPLPPHPLRSHSQRALPILAMTSMLEYASHTLVDYLAFTETDPVAMSDKDKRTLSQALHMLRQLVHAPGVPSAFPQQHASTHLLSSSSSSSSSNRVEHASTSRLSNQHAAKRSKIPSWVTVPPGTVVPPGTSAPAAFPDVSGARASSATPTAIVSTTDAADLDASKASSLSDQRTYWTDSDYKFMLGEIAKYGCRFRHVHELHGPNGTETQRLAKYTITQMQHKWHNGFKSMGDREAAEWMAEAARAGEAFDAKCVAEAAVNRSSPLNRWTEDEFQFLCEQVAKHGTQFKVIWSEHGPEGTESQTLARFTATQLQAKWHNAKKHRPEAELLAPFSDLVEARRAAEEAQPASPSVRWTDDEFNFLCQQVAKYGTQFKRIWIEHGSEGTVSQTLSRFSALQMQAKWHNTKKVRPETELLAPYSGLVAAQSATEDRQATAVTGASALHYPNRWADTEFHFLCEQVAKYGTQFKLIWSLHGLDGSESQTLARFSAIQMQAKWHNAKKHKSETDLLAPFPTSLLPNQDPAVSNKRKRHGSSRAAWTEPEFAFLCDQVLVHGGRRGLSKIWRLHGPEGTESRQLARFTLKQVQVKWYNELRGNNPRALSIKKQLDAAREADGSPDTQEDELEEDELMEEEEEDELSGADGGGDGDAGEDNRGQELDQTLQLTLEGQMGAGAGAGAGASPRKKPRVEDIKEQAFDMQKL